MQRRTLVVLALLVLIGSPLAARDIYVSKDTGSNDGDGSKGKPMKLLWKVMGDLAPGDHVFVAEGFYSGKSKLGIMPVCTVSDVVLEGGWKKDFSERNPFEYFTIVGPDPDKQGASGETFRWESPTGKIDNVTIGP